MTFSVAAAAGAAMARNGATGAVLGRMNGMVAMRDDMGAPTPVTQGLAAYDADAVSAGGKAIATYPLDPAGTGTPAEAAVPAASSIDRSAMGMSDAN